MSGIATLLCVAMMVRDWLRVHYVRAKRYHKTVERLRKAIADWVRAEWREHVCDQDPQGRQDALLEREVRCALIQKLAEIESMKAAIKSAQDLPTEAESVFEYERRTR